ncbi:unnamed protein product, partial [Discosporangium mesarthrocarpum]
CSRSVSDGTCKIIYTFPSPISLDSIDLCESFSVGQIASSARGHGGVDFSFYPALTIFVRLPREHEQRKLSTLSPAFPPGDSLLGTSPAVFHASPSRNSRPSPCAQT